MKISYFTPDDVASIAGTKTIEELVRIVLDVLARMPKPVYWVAGPITSGPLTEKTNRRRLHKTIMELKMEGAAVLNHLPLQAKAMNILRRESGGRHLSKAEEHKLQERLRDEFYAPIFQSGKIGALCLMPNSEGSLNVQWKRGFAHGRGIPVKKIPEKLVPKA